MTDRRSSLEAALDLVLYAPVGLALTLTEELPKLAAKGRSGLGARVATARVVGQFAVAQGRKEVTRRLGADVPAPARTSVPRPQAGEPSRARAATATAPRVGPVPTGSGVSEPASASRRHVEQPVMPSVASLAIPGYDSLSASQVVQRLAGLSGAELEAVKEYETASRGRRTILARVGQLQGR